MLAIAFTFPAGRYHATPWGRHVNEADVAWPPDLWRITRALIAVWHRKLDSAHFPREVLRGLLARIAEAEPPSFRLPEIAIHSHTRHYMPGKNDKRTLVFDAFARVRDEDELIIAWPGLALDDAQSTLLDALLENLGFLGRAESWVDARRTRQPQSFNCIPTEETVDLETGELTGEIVRLLAPTPPSIYREFQLKRLDAAGIKPDAKGHWPKLKRDQAALRATLPDDWLDAISVDTGDLQAAGWSAPPCARTISYSRPFHALGTRAPVVVHKPTLTKVQTGITTARFIVYGKPLPRIEDAVCIGEALRRAAMGRARIILQSKRLPAELSGHDLSVGNRHAHAFWLPEDADRDGRIDHFLVHVPGGLKSDSVRVLTALQLLRRDQGEPLRLMLEGIGTAATLSSTSRYATSSRVWHSVTPYLHPWHLKKSERHSPESIRVAITKQIRREWELRGRDGSSLETVRELPDIEAGGRHIHPLQFHRFRSKRGLIQPDTLGRPLELRFAVPVHGPLALGFGCHFGLGLFAPMATRDEQRD